jgi:hypothetical protein
MLPSCQSSEEDGGDGSWRQGARSIWGLPPFGSRPLCTASMQQRQGCRVDVCAAINLIKSLLRGCVSPAAAAPFKQQRARTPAARAAAFPATSPPRKTLTPPKQGHKVLVVGGGGREHALAWKLAQSDECEGIFCAPGSPGTAAEPGVKNVALDVADNQAVRVMLVE